jgi:hypothetical protein
MAATSHTSYSELPNSAPAVFPWIAPNTFNPRGPSGSEWIKVHLSLVELGDFICKVVRMVCEEYMEFSLYSFGRVSTRASLFGAQKAINIALAGSFPSMVEINYGETMSSHPRYSKGTGFRPLYENSAGIGDWPMKDVVISGPPIPPRSFCPLRRACALESMAELTSLKTLFSSV